MFCNIFKDLKLFQSAMGSRKLGVGLMPLLKSVGFNQPWVVESSSPSGVTITLTRFQSAMGSRKKVRGNLSRSRSVSFNQPWVIERDSIKMQSYGAPGFQSAMGSRKALPSHLLAYAHSVSISHG